MAVTVETNPNQSIDGAPKVYYGLYDDVKPTVDSHDGLPAPTAGSEFYTTGATDRGVRYITRNGTNWEKMDTITGLETSSIIDIRVLMQRQDLLLAHILAYLEVINGEKVDEPK